MQIVYNLDTPHGPLLAPNKFVHRSSVDSPNLPKRSVVTKPLDKWLPGENIWVEDYDWWFSQNIGVLCR